MLAGILLLKSSFAYLFLWLRLSLAQDIENCLIFEIYRLRLDFIIAFQANDRKHQNIFPTPHLAH